MSSYKPYPAYKDSGVEWLGKVPEHWEVKPVKSVSTCNDDVLAESTAADYEIEYLEISGIQANQGIAESVVIPFGQAPSRARRRVRHGDVIASTVRTYLRAIAQIKNPPENLIVSTGFAVVRPQTVESTFLGYLFRAEFLISEVISRSVGVSYPAINASDLVRVKIPLPAPDEQTAIAAFLDRETARIDALIATQRRLIDLLKEKRSALISHAVTKGLNPDAPMKESGVAWLGKVPEGWRVMPCRAFVDEQTAKNDGAESQRYLSLMANIGVIPYEEKGDIGNKKPEDLSKCKVVSKGDFVINSMNYGIGSYGLSPYDGVCSSVYIVLRPRLNRVESRYAFRIFENKAFQTYAQSFGNGILEHRAAINWDVLKSINVGTPSLSEQRVIIEQFAKPPHAAAVEVK